MAFFVGASPGKEAGKDKRRETADEERTSPPNLAPTAPSSSSVQDAPDGSRVPREVSPRERSLVSLPGFSFFPPAFSLPWAQRISPGESGEDITERGQTNAVSTAPLSHSQGGPAPGSPQRAASASQRSRLSSSRAPSCVGAASSLLPQNGRARGREAAAPTATPSDRERQKGEDASRIADRANPRREREAVRPHWPCAGAPYRHQGSLGDCDVPCDLSAEESACLPAKRSSSSTSRRESLVQVAESCVTGETGKTDISRVEESARERGSSGAPSGPSGSTSSSSTAREKRETRERGSDGCATETREAVAGVCGNVALPAGHQEEEVVRREKNEKRTDHGEAASSLTRERETRGEGESSGEKLPEATAQRAEGQKHSKEGDTGKDSALGLFRSNVGEGNPVAHDAHLMSSSASCSPSCSSSCSPSLSPFSFELSAGTVERQPEEEFDRYGFRVNDAERLSLKLREYSLRVQPETRERDDTWAEFVHRDPSVSDLRTLKRLVRRGIPDSLRQEVWARCLGSWTLREQRPAVFEEMAEASVPQDVEEQIELDLFRTFPSNRRFRNDATGIADLRRVLRAFAAYKPKINYCQSMNFLAATLLLFMPPDLAFWSLVQLVDSDVTGKGMKLAGYYTAGMVALRRDLKVLSLLLAKKLPRVTRTLSSVPIYTTFRIWDSLVLEGQKILFRIALAIFRMHEREIVALTSLEEVMTFWRGMLRHLVSRNELMTVAFTRIGSLSRRELRRLQARALPLVEAENRAYEARRSARLHGSLGSVPRDCSHAAPPTRSEGPLERSPPFERPRFFPFWRRWSLFDRLGADRGSPRVLHLTPVKRRVAGRSLSDGGPSGSGKKRASVAAADVESLRIGKRFFHRARKVEVSSTGNAPSRKKSSETRRPRWTLRRPASAKSERERAGEEEPQALGDATRRVTTARFQRRCTAG
ncbi:Ankyrin repeat-containing protein, related [Neospora caninum Liverpool]|uniref:Ankyrin repeat-containing protein, related n=1 Tax=Neospora caninum (strain Liverpool) TaxID=572307 RepID=F0VGI6_NEOCL|nr:Ankyrin repeat-containing protein, related [Neospora caninum Liverpool]CBZ52830.1 Ankyrin repeat-containing protein, related [Neospora caninum Liverpool]|eukprot:XP_003882862.1 Ankyrin repeat-containing protein, related [Neospora caninum Liverpool]